MFSKTITNSSSFLMMPPTSQLLYYHLGMNADDDGFCEHFVIMRMTEAKPDDLKVLAAKGFVRIFDERVLVITDWKENNYIQKDRYTPSKYLEVYKQELKLLTQNKLDTECIQDVSTMDTQVRIGKDSIGKERLNKAFDHFWEIYPRKTGKKQAEKLWHKLSPSPQLVQQIFASVELHKKSPQWTKDGNQFIPYPATFLNGQRWNDEVEIEEPKVYRFNTKE